MSKKPSLFFDSSEEEDVNFLKKNKNVFQDDDNEDDYSNVNADIKQFQQRRDANLQDLASQDAENEKISQKLKQEAQMVLMSGGVPQRVPQHSNVTTTTIKSSVFFDEEEEPVQGDKNTKQIENGINKLQIEKKQDANDATRGLFIPGGAVEWANNESDNLKNKQTQQRAETDLLLNQINDDEYIVGENSTKSSQNTSQTQPTQLKPQNNAIMSSLFDDDDDNDDDDNGILLKAQAVTNAQKAPVTSFESTLFDGDDDDDDDDNTGAGGDIFGGDSSIGDDFDFAAYLSSQK
jgi:hypothetical protein